MEGHYHCTPAEIKSVLRETGWHDIHSKMGIRKAPVICDRCTRIVVTANRPFDRSQKPDCPALPFEKCCP